ncbi:GIY-YIG nuclease family protein [Paracnuella aquatica]|uniref:GIY-YIG nuclease family protein n=1 Tax=Paracnuella aquatica TaxID=2268757 RepID=UPI000DEFE441|nr:GIY-YIG nuclease family protein [Paracnuella aquatica]RPD43452.1 GIY-YIG nuclease family protein [Paracnuella aquatica]
MDFNNIDDIKTAGFEGFKSMQQLFNDSSPLPSVKGVYLVLNIDKTPPAFLPVGTGGHFKGKNPNISLAELKANWVDKTLVVYIGKAGSDSSSATLKSRLKQYFGFGQGENVGHWGGRLIWQLASSHNLVVCWKPLLNDDPRTVEAQLIKDFVNQFGRRPFANLAD